MELELSTLAAAWRGVWVSSTLLVVIVGLLLIMGVLGLAVTVMGMPMEEAAAVESAADMIIKLKLIIIKFYVMKTIIIIILYSPLVIIIKHIYHFDVKITILKKIGKTFSIKRTKKNNYLFDFELFLTVFCSSLC